MRFLHHKPHVTALSSVPIIPSISHACSLFLAVASWVTMRTCLTILCLLLTVPVYAVDTLQVTTPDPVTEAWR